MKDSLPYGIVTTQQPIPEITIDNILKTIELLRKDQDKTDSMLRAAIHDLILKGHSIYFIGSILGLSYRQVLDTAYSHKPIPSSIWDTVRVYCEKAKIRS